MAKLTLTDLTSNYRSTSQLNANFAAIEAAIENTLSRDGTSPNTMTANLDLNSNRLLNVAAGVNPTDGVNMAQLGAAAADQAVNTDSEVQFSGIVTGDLTVTGNIIVGGTTDGRDLAIDGAKLDTVEANADVTDSANVLTAICAMSAAQTLEARECLGIPYDFGAYFSSEPSTSTDFQPIPITRDITIPADFATAVGTVGTNPASAYSIDVQDDGVTIGTISISTGGVFTFTTDGGLPKEVAAGSIISFVSPGSADGSIAEMAVVIGATLSNP